MPRTSRTAGRRRMALPGVGAFGAVALVVVAAVAWSASAVDTAAPDMRVQPRQDDGGAAPDTRLQRQPRHDGTSPSAPARRVTPATTRGVAPVEVRIPAIDVAAPVIGLGLNDDGTLEVPQVFDEAGWWTGGARPGENGPAVVAGHVDSRAGPAVFHRLRDLRPGDRVQLVGRGGRVVRFVVDRLEQHPKDDFPTDAVYGDTAHPTLRLITCGGAFDRSARSYVDNVIVYASLVA